MALSLQAVAMLVALAALARCEAKPTPSAEITPVAAINVTGYLGKWYQMYTDAVAADTFERNGWCVRAQYTLGPTGNITVYNTQRQGAVDGPQKNITGYAYVPDASEPAKLKVHFGVAPVDAPYWIIELGPKTSTEQAICSPCYDYAIVSDGYGASLFVLARDVAEFNTKYDAAVKQRLVALGFTRFYNKPIATHQDAGCMY